MAVTFFGYTACSLFRSDPSKTFDRRFTVLPLLFHHLRSALICSLPLLTSPLSQFNDSFPSERASPRASYDGKLSLRRFITFIRAQTQIQTQTQAQTQTRNWPSRLCFHKSASTLCRFITWPQQPPLAASAFGHFRIWPLQHLAKSMDGHFRIYPLQHLTASRDGHFISWPLHHMTTSIGGHFSI